MALALPHIVSVLLLIHLHWRYRAMTSANAVPVGGAWRFYLSAQAAIYGLYGIALFLWPQTYSAFWPWKIDAFHAQVYSAIFVSGGVVYLVAMQKAAPSDWLALSLAVFRFFSVLGLVFVDAGVHRANWRARYLVVGCGAPGPGGWRSEPGGAFSGSRGVVRPLFP